MNKKIIFFLFLIFTLSSCSLDTKTKLWNKKDNESKQTKVVVQDVFEKSEPKKNEFNKNITVYLKGNFKEKSFINNQTNNNGYLNFDGITKKKSKIKFSKIKDFNFVEPDLLFTKDGSIIFFDNKGNIFKFNSNLKILWKKNIYNKNEKKMNPVIFFESVNGKIIAADNIANYYLIDSDTGKLLWKKNNSAPFNSQIKIYGDKFFVVDFDNILRCYSIIDGKEIWNFKTEKSFIKSQKKLSMIIHNNKVVFINTLGDLSSLDISTGKLSWQTPTQSNVIYENAFSLKNSDLVFSNGFIYFSNNKNEFFAIDSKNGFVKWKQNINSSLRPTIIDNLVITISNEGLLIIMDQRNGNILRITNIFNKIDNNENKIMPTGFIVSKNNKLYLSLNNGRLLKVNLVNGITENMIKYDKNKILRPYVFEKKMYLVKDDSILQLN